MNGRNAASKFSTKKNTENKNYPNKIEERNKTTEIVLYSRAHL